MKKTLLIAALALAGLSSPVLAQTAVVGGVAGQASHFDSASQGGSFSFNGAGTGSASSASGFNATLGGSNGVVAFNSTGLGSVSTAVTPFSSDVTTFHAASAGGVALGGTSFNASTLQTFAQGNTTNAFNANVSGGWTQTESNFATVAGGVAFASFGGFGF